MKRKLIPVGSVAIAASALFLFCAAPTSGHAERALAPQPPPVTATLELPNVASLAARVNPTVVSIESEHEVQFSQHTPTPDWPFGDNSPFRFFFGNPPSGHQIERGLGSGFVIADGLIVTNYHVVQNADKLEVTATGSDGVEKTYKGTVVGKAPEYDVALVKTDGPIPGPKAVLGDSDAMHIGDWVMAVGTPFGLSHSVSIGIISAKGRLDVDPSGHQGLYDFIQTDASINPGNSGGPLVDMAGEVIGINTAINAAGQGIGFAIPINMVKRLLPQLREKGSFSRAWIGVTIQPVTAELAQSFGLDEARGALVSQVVDDGPGARAGLEAGDIILTFAGKPVRTSSELPILASLAGVGTKEDLTVWRHGAQRTVTIELGAYPEASNVTEQDPGWQGQALGVAVSDLTPELRAHLGTKLRHGAVVTEVESGSPADDAGLQEGDIIVSANGHAVRSASELIAKTKAVARGKVVRMQVQRGEAVLFVAIRIPTGE